MTGEHKDGSVHITKILTCKCCAANVMHVGHVPVKAGELAIGPSVPPLGAWLAAAATAASES